MQVLKSPVLLRTAFDQYELTHIIGEGGAGRVYCGTDSSNRQVAIKVLHNQSSDKIRRFKNELFFCLRNRHDGILTVRDYGLAEDSKISGPFYVMDRYAENLRTHIDKGLSSERAFQIILKILDGVEAAHLLQVTHRDLKPENFLVHSDGAIVVADFGIARFTSDDCHELLKTPENARLANFQYAAPEQRLKGNFVEMSADIYALGLIINELFTGSTPIGTDYTLIGQRHEEYAFLDEVVSQMIRQEPSNRPQSISAVKSLIEKYAAEQVSRQRLDEINRTVIPEGDITDPLAFDPPKITGVSFTENNALQITLNQPVSQEWVYALHNMQSFRSVMGVPPTSFRFRNNVGTVSIRPEDAQRVVDQFKAWLPNVTTILHSNLQREHEIAAIKRKEQLERQRRNEERLAQINRDLKF